MSVLVSMFRRPEAGCCARRVKDVLDLLVTHFDDVYRELNLQMKKIAKMQDQLDVMAATLGARTGR